MHPRRHGLAQPWVMILPVAVPTSRHGGVQKLGSSPDHLKILAIGHPNLVTVAMLTTGVRGLDIIRALGTPVKIMRLTTKDNMHSNKLVKENRFNLCHPLF